MTAERQEKDGFKLRVKDWAGKLGVAIRSLTVRPMKTKWASCTTGGRLTFNSDLLGMDEQLVDYVIVHELLHFSVPNHGKLWKSLMRAHLGKYEVWEEQLKETALRGTNRECLTHEFPSNDQ
jgi:predicted metal-dependent hydrolase